MIGAFLKSTDRLFTSPKLALFFSINGLFQKKELYTPVEDINFFEVDPPWISSQIYRNPPGIFLFLHWPNQRLLLYPPGIFLLISSTGGLQFISGKAIYEKIARKTYIGGSPNFVIGDKSSEPDPSSNWQPQPLEKGIHLVVASTNHLDDGELKRLRCNINDSRKVHSTFFSIILCFFVPFMYYLYIEKVCFINNSY